MEENEILKEKFLEIVENQIKSENPPETKITYKRLIGLGYTKIDSKKFIAQCVVLEMFGIMKKGEPFDEKRFINNLLRLPDEPLE